MLTQQQLHIKDLKEREERLLVYVDKLLTIISNLTHIEEVEEDHISDYSFLNCQTPGFAIGPVANPFEAYLEEQKTASNLDKKI